MAVFLTTAFLTTVFFVVVLFAGVFFAAAFGAAFLGLAADLVVAFFALDLGFLAVLLRAFTILLAKAASSFADFAASLTCFSSPDSCLAVALSSAVRAFCVVKLVRAFSIRALAAAVLVFLPATAAFLRAAFSDFDFCLALLAWASALAETFFAVASFFARAASIWVSSLAIFFSISPTERVVFFFAAIVETLSYVICALRKKRKNQELDSQEKSIAFSPI